MPDELPAWMSDELARRCLIALRLSAVLRGAIPVLAGVTSGLLLLLALRAGKADTVTEGWATAALFLGIPGVVFLASSAWVFLVWLEVCIASARGTGSPHRKS